MDMTTHVEAAMGQDTRAGLVRDRDQAEGYVAMVCFKHGPPALHGIELEWTTHDRHDPAQPVDPARLGAALGRHAPRTLAPDSPNLPLTAGSLVTVEPGGQVEISTAPSASLGALIDTVRADGAHLDRLLATRGLVRGQRGLDPHRPPRRILQVPRYAAMEAAFDPIGAAGLQMMCSSASVQVCLDAGEPAEVGTRWRAAHSLGPPLVALFANSTHRAGRHTGWASARTRATLATCPPVTGPPPATSEPATWWARLAMSAPVLCVRGPGPSWQAPAGLTFGDWVDRPSLVGRPATLADLDYHLSTLFPPVRPRGYLEIRYLDAQPGDGWVAPLVLLAALMATRRTVDHVLDVTEPAAGLWWEAARLGLDDPQLRAVAEDVVHLGCQAVGDLGLDRDTVDTVTHRLGRLLSDRASRRCYA